jgi:glycosyltransferase involved in cell wall biosynthesis
MGRWKRAFLSVLVQALRHWDLSASREPDHFIANSRTVAARILQAYGRHAEVIHPPIDIRRFKPASEHEDYYLVLARLVSYKRIDLAIEACNLLGRSLLVIGEGPDRARLQKLAGATITFAGRLSDREVERHASRCRAVLFPGEEDFGMVPLEVAAAGRPAIAYRAGGATETIVDGVSGVFFNRQEAASLVEAIERFEKRDWCPEAIRRHAESFSIDAFQNRFLAFLSRVGVRSASLIELPQTTSYRVREASWDMHEDIAV